MTPARPWRPRRRDELLVEELDGELLVYDTTTHRAHCLAQPVALLFDRCTGERTFDELAVALALSRADLADMLRALRDAQLLVDEAQVTRRELLTSGGRVAAAAFITTLLVPRAAAASSCVHLMGACATGTCCIGLVCLPLGPGGMMICAL